MFGALYYPLFFSWDFCFSAVGYSAKKNKKSGARSIKRLIWIAYMFTCLALKDFWNFEFLLCLKSDFVQFKFSEF
jgi:hypothetical protein